MNNIVEYIKMGKLIYTDTDINDTKAQYIAHQCNCTGTRSMGISKHIFERYPYANVYALRSTHDKPGTISFHGYDYGEPQGIINMYAQYKPGSPDNNGETKAQRLLWFRECLDVIRANIRVNGIVSIAFPYRVGCGSGGGDWDQYLEEIQKFANNNNITVYIHKPLKL